MSAAKKVEQDSSNIRRKATLGRLQLKSIGEKGEWRRDLKTTRNIRKDLDISHESVVGFHRG